MAGDLRAVVVIDIGFGDSGKGATVDYLVRKHRAALVVRYNGGAQAAHHVVLPDGRFHAFAQWGAGTLAGATTHLSRFMLVDPWDAREEAAALRDFVPDPWALVSVDPNAVVITPWHVALNRAREKSRGRGRHGSVGKGIGEARKDELAGRAIRVRDLRDPDLKARLIKTRDAKWEEMLSSGLVGYAGAGLFRDEVINETADLYRSYAKLVQIRPDADVIHYAPGPIIFEGAQGVLLDETWGFAPHNTWTDCTTANARRLLRDAQREGDVSHIAVARSYMTRHGYGPLPTEGAGAYHSELHNETHEWMGAFRQGAADMEAFRYALRALGHDGVSLALTHMDRVGQDWVFAKSYAQPLPDRPVTAAEVSGSRVFLIETPGRHARDVFEAELGVPVALEAYGATYRDRREIKVEVGV